VPIDAWFGARPVFSRVSRPVEAKMYGDPEPLDCPTCGVELRIAHAYLDEGSGLWHLETYRCCPNGCPGTW
jgi:hypothetical protein